LQLARDTECDDGLLLARDTECDDGLLLPFALERKAAPTLQTDYAALHSLSYSSEAVCVPAASAGSTSPCLIATFRQELEKVKTKEMMEASEERTKRHFPDKHATHLISTSSTTSLLHPVDPPFASLSSLSNPTSASDTSPSLYTSSVGSTSLSEPTANSSSDASARRNFVCGYVRAREERWLFKTAQAGMLCGLDGWIVLPVRALARGEKDGVGRMATSFRDHVRKCQLPVA